MPQREQRVLAGLLVGGSSAESLCGAIALVLSIIGLASGPSLELGAVSSIVLGAALLVFTGAVAMRFRREGRFPPERENRVKIVGPLGSEGVGGIIGIVFGILALAGVAPLTMLSIGVIGLGGGVLFGAPEQEQLDGIFSEADARRKHIMWETIRASSIVMAVVGAGAAVLGILALIGVAPVTLSLVGTLVLGAGLLFAGAAVAFRFGWPLYQRRTA